MPNITSAGLIETIRSLRLLSDDQWALVTGSLRKPLPPHPQAITQELVRQGWLTDYQANELLQGRGMRLLLGGYQVRHLLGAGGTGEVFKAWDPRLRRQVAIKRIEPRPGDDRESPHQALIRFDRESQAFAHLSHPHIVTVFDAGREDKCGYLVMELLDGMDLKRWVKQQGRLPVHEACAYILQAALGLLHVHERGLIHRDIKPGNLMRLLDGRIKVMDFGLVLLNPASTITPPGGLMGTLDYLAPEQARDPHQVDPRADIYALGCTLIHLLTGKPPFGHVDLFRKLEAHQKEPPPDLDRLYRNLPRGLAPLVCRMLAKDPAQRPATAAAVAEALQPFACTPKGPDVGTSVSGWRLEEEKTDPRRTHRFLPPTPWSFCDSAEFTTEHRTFLARKGKRQGQLTVFCPLPTTAKKWMAPLEERLSALRQVKHPALLPLFQQGSSVQAGYAFVVTAPPAGLSLDQHLLQHGSLSLDEARRLFLDLFDGLAALHAHGLVHGNIHPGSILLTNGSGVLTDYALEGGEDVSQRSLSGPRQELAHLFATPEQAHQHRKSFSTDVYSLAGCLYHALAYAVPEQRMLEWVSLEVIPPSLHAPLLRALDPEPERRPEARTFGTWLRATSPAQVVAVCVPGVWFQREARALSAPASWIQAGSTPGKVPFHFNQHYHLRVDPATTSREFRSLNAVASKPPLRSLSLGRCSRLSDEDLAVLPGWTTLQHIDLSGCPLTGEGLRHLQALHALHTLQLNECWSLSEESLRHLQRMPSLQHLSLSRSPIGRGGLAHLAAVRDLRTLHLVRCMELGDEDLVPLGSLGTLEALSLRGCCQLTGTGLVHLKERHSLRHLDLRECWRLDGATLSSLRLLAGLEFLNLGWLGQLQDEHLTALAGLQRLRHVDLTACKRITGEGLKGLAHATSLTTLSLAHCDRFTDQALIHLQPLPLRNLDLTGCLEISDEGLALLHPLPLEALTLNGCRRITDAGLKQLAKGTARFSLERLELNGCGLLTDRGLSYLSALPLLQWLDLSWCELLSARGLEHVRTMNALKRLHLPDHLASEENRARVQDWLPGCEVLSARTWIQP
jgi:serine/threonine protein kinase